MCVFLFILFISDFCTIPVYLYQSKLLSNSLVKVIIKHYGNQSLPQVKTSSFENISLKNDY